MVYVKNPVKLVKLKEMVKISEKEMFTTALKYFEAAAHDGYKDLKEGDDVYDMTLKQENIIMSFYSDIVANGSTWAREYLENLK